MRVFSYQRSAIRFLLILASGAAATVEIAAQQSAVAPAPAVREVVDETGRTVRVPAEVRRIVSLAPSMTETIYALGAEERLVGVTTFCDYPPEARAKPKIGGAMNPSVEQIVVLKPDLVLAAKTANRRETVEALERLGIAVYANNPHSVDDVLESTRRIAELIGAQEQGEALVAGLRARLVTLKQRLAGRTPRAALFVVWHEPLITIGRHTFLADALRQAGARLAVELEQDWPRLSLEEVVRVQPEYLVFASSHSEEVAHTVDDLRARPGWRNLTAIRSGHTATISDAVNRPAPRLIEAIEELARQLHPEAFANRPENGKGTMEKPEGLGPPHFPFSLFHSPSAERAP